MTTMLACTGGRNRADPQQGNRGGKTMGNIFYVIGVVVVVFAILGYFGLR
jgi:hypothetical protein